MPMGLWERSFACSDRDMSARDGVMGWLSGLVGGAGRTHRENIASWTSGAGRVYHGTPQHFLRLAQKLGLNNAPPCTCFTRPTGLAV